MGMRISINGFGRIGRNVFRVIHSKFPDVEVVHINDLTDPATLAHLLKYDSVHGPFAGKVEAGKDFIKVDGKKISVTAIKDPVALPHKANDVDFVVESTGIFTSREQCQKHIDAGAKRVLLTVPPKDEVDAMVVLGVNEDTLKPEHRIISNASCTTNCLAPLAKVLHENFGIVRGLMTTVHAYTNDQQVLDLPHKDLRRARAAALNIIPTTTGAARAVGKVLPALKGKLDGISLRVPVPDGSVVDLVAEVSKDVTIEELNAAFAAAAKSKGLKGVLEFSTDPLVSTDIVRNSHSTIFDSLSTMVMGGRMVKLVAWYDNEWGYSNRVVELMKLANKLKLPKAAKEPVAAGK
jgi:glyceraldehyde 3-phosphate dehydrogenase